MGGSEDFLLFDFSCWVLGFGDNTWQVTHDTWFFFCFTLSDFLISVQLSAHVKRFSVSRVQVFSIRWQEFSYLNFTLLHTMPTPSSDMKAQAILLNKNFNKQTYNDFVSHFRQGHLRILSLKVINDNFFCPSCLK